MEQRVVQRPHKIMWHHNICVRERFVPKTFHLEYGLTPPGIYNPMTRDREYFELVKNKREKNELVKQHQKMMNTSSLKKKKQNLPRMMRNLLPNAKLMLSICAKRWLVNENVTNLASTLFCPIIRY